LRRSDFFWPRVDHGFRIDARSFRGAHAEYFRLLLLDLSPYHRCTFPDALLRHELARHGHQDVVAFLDGLQTLTRELPFHRQRDQQLFPHQPQTRFLHGAGVVEKLDVDVRPLPDSPRPPTGLPQRVDRIARLVEVNLREGPEI